MGTKLVPTLATIYLACIEEALLEEKMRTPHTRLRYIDDICSADTLDSFLQGLIASSLGQNS